MVVGIPDLLQEADVLKGQPLTFTTESSTVLMLIQINLLLTFLRSGGQLCALEDYCTQVAVMTGHLASTGSFKWSSSKVSAILISNHHEGW